MLWSLLTKANLIISHIILCYHTKSVWRNKSVKEAINLLDSFSSCNTNKYGSFLFTSLLKALMCELRGLHGAFCLWRLFLPHFSIVSSTHLEYQEVYSDFCLCVLFSIYFNPLFLLFAHSGGMVILIIECSVQGLWHGTIEPFYWKCFLLTDLDSPVFSTVRIRLWRLQINK